MRQRWYVVLLGLTLTAGLCYASVLAIPPVYRAEASVVLLPGESTVPDDSNPFLYLGGLAPARDVLARAITSDEASDGILEGRPATSYMVQADFTTAGPILLIEVEAPSSRAALEAQQAVLVALPVALEQLQKDREVTPSARIESMDLATQSQPTIVRSRIVRTLIVVLAAGAALTVLAASWLDGILLLRETRRGEQEPSSNRASSGDLPPADEHHIEAPEERSPDPSSSNTGS